MLWFDHAMWFMINNLEHFFDETYPNLAAKYAVCTMMEDVALEATVNPDNCLLAKFYELGAARWNSSSRMWLFH
jgi:hypothetical protein